VSDGQEALNRLRIAADELASGLSTGVQVHRHESTGWWVTAIETDETCFKGEGPSEAKALAELVRQFR